MSGYPFEFLMTAAVGKRVATSLPSQNVVANHENLRLQSLCGFARIQLSPGRTPIVSVNIQEISKVHREDSDINICARTIF